MYSTVFTGRANFLVICIFPFLPDQGVITLLCSVLTVRISHRFCNVYGKCSLLL